MSYDGTCGERPEMPSSNIDGQMYLGHIVPRISLLKRSCTYT